MPQKWQSGPALSEAAANLSKLIWASARKQTRIASGVQATSVPGWVATVMTLNLWSHQSALTQIHGRGTRQRWHRIFEVPHPMATEKPAAPNVTDDAQMTSLTMDKSPLETHDSSYGFRMSFILHKRHKNRHKYISEILFSAHQTTKYQLRLAKLYD